MGNRRERRCSDSQQDMENRALAVTHLLLSPDIAKYTVREPRGRLAPLVVAGSIALLLGRAHLSRFCFFASSSSSHQQRLSKYSFRPTFPYPGASEFRGEV